MEINKKKLAAYIALPLIVGGLSSILTRNGMEMFGILEKPPLSPPAWLFPAVWTILYVLMGLSAYIIEVTGKCEEQVSDTLKIYYYQLIVNFLWPIFFFGFEWYIFSFLWLLLLWALVALMIRKFAEISRIAAYINIPYIIWLTFAAYLNFGIWWINR